MIVETAGFIMVTPGRWRAGALASVTAGQTVAHLIATATARLPLSLRGRTPQGENINQTRLQRRPVPPRNVSLFWSMRKVNAYDVPRQRVVRNSEANELFVLFGPCGRTRFVGMTIEDQGHRKIPPDPNATHERPDHPGEKTSQGYSL